MSNAPIGDPAGDPSPRPRGQTTPRGPYSGVVVVMGTMHGKQDQVAPVFAEVLGARVLAPAGIDTDRFGTFTGETARTLTPVAAVTAKARLAMAMTGSPYGMASEASYGMRYGVLPVHEEVLNFIDDTRGIEIVEGLNTPGAPGVPRLVGAVSHATPGVPGSPRLITGTAAALEAAREFGFPAQGAVVTTMAAGRLHVSGKGLDDVEDLIRAVQGGLKLSDTGQVCVEPDLRAHLNPSRRQALTCLAERLARRLATPCPACQAPGYGKTAVLTGLLCRACGLPTDLVAADVHRCAACGHQHHVPRPQRRAEPQWCDYCNP
ncbi:hypothetical protein TUM20983_37200 [Mycobacterium antarcticum]|uniref:DUF6671 family protein n=1 Tax=Mycolicibacterium sp. TUM20983 TaxID=3023369 RepID=UPI002387A288|nr:DUF6671 family protein [Mycolicibacterium sp. TUM20983]GLP76610.1 hypothetical protein TUM20983_37200 [Mycolicibacterium sp. TUM20983]